jgi:2-polyprenyl-3-methyl-5-hydroxy-6-metoxy-1,4-benzoquinol methylase
VKSAGCPLCANPTAAEIAADRASRLVRCHACMLTYSDPPRRTAVVRDDYERLYRRDTEVSRVTGRRLAVFGEFFELVAPTPGGRLLDVGCGTGDFLLLARERGWRPTGIDLSERAVARARQVGLDARTDWAGLPSDHFDVVTLWNVVEFLERPMETLRDVRRVLVPGGIAFVRTPNERFQLAAYRWRRRLAWCAPLARVLSDAYYFQPVVWSSETLAAALRRADFADIRLWNSRPSAGDPYHERSRGREAAVHAAKRLVHACARGAGAATRGRMLIGSSISALARKPPA